MLEEKVDVQNKNNIQIDKPLKLSYTVEKDRIENNTITTTKKDESVKLIIDSIPFNSELYLSINNLKYIDDDKTDFKVTAKLDGITNSESLRNSISSAYYMDNPNFLMNLGVSKKNQKKVLEVTFNKKGTYTFDSFEILAVDMKKYERKIDKLNGNVMQNIQYGNNYISGNIDLEEDGILQITTSYSDGWKAFADEKEVEVLKVNEAFIGIKVGEGEHAIRFEYETPYLKLGMMLSAVGLLVYMILITIELKKRNSVSL